MIGGPARRHRFKVLKQSIVGPRDTAELRQVEDPFAAKLEELRRTFEGASELCFYHAEVIVSIRRGIDVPENWTTFSSLWEQESQYLCANLNSRWLVSALDTYADHGSHLRTARALIQIAFFNSVRLAETERALSDAAGGRAKLAEMDRIDRVELWDGVCAYNLRHGDMVWNMLARIRRCLAPDPVLSAIFETLLARALQHDTLISRVNQISEHARKEITPNSDL